MRRSIAIGACVCAAALIGFATESRAAWFTTNATIDVRSFDAADALTIGPPLEQIITGFTAGGGLFTNTISSPGVVGGEIRTVGGVRIESLTNLDGLNFDGILGPGLTSSNLIVVFGLSGIVTAVGGPGETEFTATFTHGRLGIFRQNTSMAGQFSSMNPLTWDNPDLAGNRFNDPIYVADLGPQATVVQGPDGAQIGVFPASIMNTSSVNSLAGQQSQGRFLFLESEDPTAAFLASLNTQSEFIQIPLPVPGLFSTVDQVLRTNFSNEGTGTLTPEQQAALNTIAEWAGLSLLVSGDITGHFATFGSGDQTDWIPTFVNGVNTSGDFFAELQSQFHPVGIPEPSSMALLAFGAAFSGLYAGARRRRRKQEEQNAAA